MERLCCRAELTWLLGTSATGSVEVWRCTSCEKPVTFWLRPVWMNAVARYVEQERERIIEEAYRA